MTEFDLFENVDFDSSSKNIYSSDEFVTWRCKLEQKSFSIRKLV